MFEKAITNQIQIEASSAFVPENSNRNKHEFFFSYRIRIHNLGSAPVQVLNRYWLITDGLGRSEEVRGPGVIGQQPTIAAGGLFEYESFCPLSTPTGTMRGSLQIRSESGEIFDAQVPLFFLVEPSAYH